MLFWHGGNLDDYKDNVKHKKGKYEYGPGLYATTHYDTARKYSKGGKKLYLLEIEKGNELSKSKLQLDDVRDFINSNVTKSKREDVSQRIEKYNKDNYVPAMNLVNIVLNEEAIRPSKMNTLREFLVSNNIDYELVSSPFGWHETMIVLYNINKISSKKQIKPKDKIKEYDLSAIGESESMESVVASTNQIARTLHIEKSLEITNNQNGRTEMSEDLIFASEEEAMQHLANLTGKSIKIAEKKKESAIDGMSKQRAKTYINKLMEKHSKGFFDDEYWSPVQEILKDMGEDEIDYVVDNTEYKKDEEGRPSSKKWMLTIQFVDDKGKEQKLAGHIIASGAGSVEDPLDRYDIVAYVG